jgi:DNA-binding transcriptional LysR family regulator
MDPRRLGQIDLNLLFTLHEVGRLGSVTAAARALGRTQPAISTRLRQLEKQLGVTLFERAGPLLRFSPVGRAVLEEVGLLVAQLGAVIDRTRGIDAEPVGTVRVGALPTLCAYMLAPVAVRLTRAHPRAHVRMTPGLTASQLDALRGGEIDVLVSVGLIRDPALRVRALGEIDACLVAPARIKLPRGPLTVRHLDSFECVAYGKIGDPFFDAVWEFLERTNLARRVRVEVPNIQAIKQLILDGGGISILPRYTIVEPTLIARELRGLDVRLPLCVATRPRGDDAPIVRELLRELSAEVDARTVR